MKIRLYFAILFALLTAACTQHQPEMTLDRLLASHAQARGGKDALENIRTLDVTLEIVEPGFTLTGHYRASREGVMRIDVFASGERVFTEALGPNGGWQMFGDGKTADLSPGGAEILRNGIAGNLYALHEIPALGYSLTFIGSAERNGGAFWEIEEISPEGFSEHLFLDKDTFLIASSVETSALHPDIDSTEVHQETFYLDYKDNNGVLFNTRSEKRNLDTGEVMQTSAITSRQLNLELDPSQFDRPTGG